MDTKVLFTMALGLQAPWEVIDLKFDEEAHRLDILLDFKRGADFPWSATSPLGKLWLVRPLNQRLGLSVWLGRARRVENFNASVEMAVISVESNAPAKGESQAGFALGREGPQHFQEKDPVFQSDLIAPPPEAPVVVVPAMVDPQRTAGSPNEQRAQQQPSNAPKTRDHGAALLPFAVILLPGFMSCNDNSLLGAIGKPPGMTVAGQGPGGPRRGRGAGYRSVLAHEPGSRHRVAFPWSGCADPWTVAGYWLSRTIYRSVPWITGNLELAGTALLVLGSW